MSMGTFLGGKVHGGLWKVYAPRVKKNCGSSAQVIACGFYQPFCNFCQYRQNVAICGTRHFLPYSCAYGLAMGIERL